ncbi:MAG: TadE/TadG family type IV pilus assembly protein [Terriglobales bacterium]
MRRTTKTRGRQRGQATAEAAITIIIVFVVVFWVFELSMLMYTYSVISDAANEGVRHAIVTSGGGGTGTQTCGGSPSGTAQVVCNFAKLSLHNTSALSVTVTLLDTTATPPHRIQVHVSYAYVPYLPKFIGSPTMSAYAQGAMVVE